MAKALNAAERGLLSPIFAVGSTGALTLMFDGMHLFARLDWERSRPARDNRRPSSRNGFALMAIEVALAESDLRTPSSLHARITQFREAGVGPLHFQGNLVRLPLLIWVICPRAPQMYSSWHAQSRCSLAEGKLLSFLSPWLHDDGPVALNHTTCGSNPGANPDSFSAFTGWDPVKDLWAPDFD
ncbi:hypothetical protein EDB86DRAFT_2828746 [Lactarius hatsudake]|nr:hypothetical protein EDB86DRAFT_2828746 [Lactarius hatsudake]